MWIMYMHFLVHLKLNGTWMSWIHAAGSTVQRWIRWIGEIPTRGWHMGVMIFRKLQGTHHGKSPFLMGKSTISMVIFNSYVKLPEGISCQLPNGRYLWVGGTPQPVEVAYSADWTIFFQARSKTAMWTLVQPQTCLGSVTVPQVLSERQQFTSCTHSRILKRVKDDSSQRNIYICVFVYIYIYRRMVYWISSAITLIM